MMRVVALMSLLVACQGVDSRAGPGFDGANVPSLAGAWDARLSLTNPYQLGASAPRARMICGTIGFVDNRHATAVDTRPAAGIGVYDLDLSRLGLNWIGHESFPEAIATSVDVHDVKNADRGFVTIVLNPGSSERIVLLGRHDGPGIAGEWQAQSLRGTATGRFSLLPHGIVTPSC
jgi:hypothetical protein